MFKDLRKTIKLVSLFFYILQLPHTVISNSEKLTHPSVYSANAFISTGIRIIIGGGFFHAIQIWTGVESVLIILPTVKIKFFYF